MLARSDDFFFAGGDSFEYAGGHDFSRAVNRRTKPGYSR
jgi:hypothetical protein